MVSNTASTALLAAALPPSMRSDTRLTSSFLFTAPPPVRDLEEVIYD